MTIICKKEDLDAMCQLINKIFAMEQRIEKLEKFNKDMFVGEIKIVSNLPQQIPVSKVPQENPMCRGCGNTGINIFGQKCPCNGTYKAPKKKPKFAVGDKVSTYTVDYGRKIGWINQIDLNDDTLEIRTENDRYEWFHMKQCRKLRKKK